MPNTNAKAKAKPKIQTTMLTLITKARSRGPFVFLMLKYVPSNPPATPIIPPTMPPISPGFISRLSFCGLIWPKSRFYGNKFRIPPVTEEKPAKGYEKKSEIRMQTRMNPKIKIRNRDSDGHYSDFGLLSAFGFRFSDFIRPPAPQTDSGFRPPPRRDWRRCPRFPRGALRGNAAAGDAPPPSPRLRSCRAGWRFPRKRTVRLASVSVGFNCSNNFSLPSRTYSARSRRSTCSSSVSAQRRSKIFSAVRLSAGSKPPEFSAAA